MCAGACCPVCAGMLQILWNKAQMNSFAEVNVYLLILHRTELRAGQVSCDFRTKCIESMQPAGGSVDHLIALMHQLTIPI